MLVRREWEPEELIAAWTLLDDDWELVSNKSGATRLGFSLMLKFFELEARFPRHVGEFPKTAVDYVAGQVKVEPGLLADYPWTGSTIEYHRSQIRKALGLRESTRADEDASALVFVNTVLVQSLLKDPAWADRLTDADRRALSPLFWSHANLYGTIQIDMDTHLDLDLVA
ncbi:Tn3 transposase DDE domain-containing protein [Streptosporangium subroseum]|uniref:Tn3 transposase DDE domain-containing protein n=1 Tax=Streptosporangium subroseum TaxID=106412 RepID=A0A239P0Z2_9ACTN|nr:DUF4158 domain-containing protein [Streptosporangium subroseum]SNT60680.1 Tn3 transposase DDE domain-containing protein [Streptosporangium subroseum]